METLNASTVTHSKDFQADLTTAILNTFQMDTEADLEHAENFDKINARFLELVNYLVQAPAHQLAVSELQKRDNAARTIIQECYSAHY